MNRRSQPRVTDESPTHEQVTELLAAAANVADHGGIAPWRMIEIRGDQRIRLGQVLGTRESPSPKPMRAPLLIAVVACREPSRYEKAPKWEQDAVATGVAYMLSLLLGEAGWGVMWRTGDAITDKRVKRFHGLGNNEKLMGWLYVGGLPGTPRTRLKQATVDKKLTALPE